jgi:hypothetical protein
MAWLPRCERLIFFSLHREWAGNAEFRDLVASRLDDYSSATSKLEKSAIVSSVLTAVRAKSPNGGFIKKDPLTGQWYEVGERACSWPLLTSELRGSESHARTFSPRDHLTTKVGDFVARERVTQVRVFPHNSLNNLHDSI